MSDDMDLDLDDDFEDEVDESSSLKEMWDNNPFLKIGLLVVIVITVGFIYMKFIAAGKDDSEDKSAISGGSMIRGTVGEEVSSEYKSAIEETNEQRKDWAERVGSSALPTPIGRPRGQLEISDKIDPKNLSIDPLHEWRKTAEARRFEMDFPEEEEDEAVVPDMVPIVEPIRPQVENVLDPELVSKLTEQMSTIISTKEPQPAQIQGITSVESEYAIFIEEQEELEQAAIEASEFDEDFDGELGSEDLDGEEEEVLIAAGQVVYAQLLNNLNSDIPGPALAHILSGPMAGGRAIGSFSKQDEYLVITFGRIIKDNISYAIDTIALDPDTTLNAMATDVNHHYFTRIILPAAAEFVSGVGEGITDVATSSTTGAGGVTTEDKAELDTEEIIAEGVTQSFDKVSEIISDGSEREITVTVEKGTPMGLLFLETLKEGDGE